LREKNKITH